MIIFFVIQYLDYDLQRAFVVSKHFSSLENSGFQFKISQILSPTATLLQAGCVDEVNCKRQLPTRRS